MQKQAFNPDRSCSANPEKINNLIGIWIIAHIKKKINLHAHIQIKQVLKSLRVQRSKVFKWDFFNATLGRQRFVSQGMPTPSLPLLACIYTRTNTNLKLTAPSLSLKFTKFNL
jgi:hypothetical protein